MNIPDLAPLSYLSEFYQIPIEIIVLVIFLFGYLTVRISQKNHSLPAKLDSLDTVFILTFSGMTWFIRIALALFWIKSFVITYLTDSETIQKLGNFAIAYIYSLIIFICLSSVIDVRAIKHKQLLDKKPLKRYKYQFINRWNDWFEEQRFKFIVIISIFFAVFLSFGLFIQGMEYIVLSVFYLFMMTFAVVPSITLLFKLINKILPSETID